MPFDVRPITPDELPEFLRVDSITFGDSLDPEDVTFFRDAFDFGRSLATFDRGHIVGTSGGFGFQLTLPGAIQVPAHGLSWVGVLPTHRRRGILRDAMRRQFADMRERGEAVSILLCSESSIYGRFGYGPATFVRDFEIDPRYGRLLSSADAGGSVEMVDREVAARLLPPVYERMFLGQPGAIDRTELGWRGYLRDLESRRKGRSEIFYAVHRTEAGDVDGYASYHIKGHWEHGIPAHILTLRELIGLTQQARAALWAYCMSVDLVVRVEVSNRPVDDPIQWMLADPRRLRTTLSSDFLWVRLVDIPAALAARRYAMEGRLVLDIADPFLPENSGRYLLEGGPDGAVCQRSDGAPDVALDVSDLGALFLGGVAATTLARAGRIQECRSGAVRLADAMFLTQPAPWCITEF